MDKDYVCTLTEASIKTAREELNEIPSDRLAAVQAFREWIEQQKYIKCPTDTRFLLMFLRGRKFSQLEARKLLQEYLIRRKKHAHMFHNLDPLDPAFLTSLARGSVYVLPGTDTHGRKVLLMRLGIMDPEYMKKNKVIIFRTMATVLDSMFLDENTQVNGIVNILDFSSYGMALHNAVSISERKDFSGVWQKGYPARIKAVHFYNMGIMLEFFMGLVKIIMTEKIQKRIQTHSDLENLYQHVPMEILPQDYLPDDYEGPSAGSFDDILKGMKAYITSPEVAARVKYINSSDHYLDESLKPGDLPRPESFRKLNLD